ncbi:MAG: S8 family serine peptidase [Myxococcota bacterium]
MNRSLGWWLAVALTGCTPAPDAADDTAQDATGAAPAPLDPGVADRPTDWLVQLGSTADARVVDAAAVVDAFVARLPGNVTPLRAFRSFPVAVVHTDDADGAAALARIPGIVAIEPDAAHEATLTESLALIHQPDVAADGFIGTGTAVAVLDTGADWTRADLGSCTAVGAPSTCRVVYATDYAPDDGVKDTSGHGTNVSSIVARVAPGTDIIALDVFNGSLAYSSDIIAAIDWVVANKNVYGIVAINMSLGSGSYTAPCNDIFSATITSAHAAGISVVVASGNNAYTNAIASPACSAASFSVGAVYDSNLGAIGWSGCNDSSSYADKVTCFSNSASFLDVLAPGALINAGGYVMGGTSQASPHVAGAVAVLRGADLSATADDVETKLRETGVDVIDARNGLTFPRIDLAAAVADCVTGLGTTSLTPGADGDSGTVEVTADAGCAWSAMSDAGWLPVVDGSGVGTASFGWSADPNTGAERVGHVVVSGRTVTVTQAAHPAPTGTITIAGGASGTKTAAVTLTLASADAATMCISNTTTCTSWQTYATSLPWTLNAGSGSRTVYATFRDAYDNASAQVSDTIVIDTTLPANGTVTATGADAAVTLAWTGFTDAGAGVASYKVAQATGTVAPANCTTTVWTGAGAGTTIASLVNGTTYAWRVCAVDGAGNVSGGSVVSARPAPEYVAPTGSIVINAGSAYTALTATTVTLAATDDTSVASACLSNTTTCTTWFTMDTTKAWTVTAGTGTKTVYGWFKDPYGNVSSMVSDTIVLDATKPTNGTVTAAGADASAAVSWTGFTDANGIASYTLVYGTSSPAACTSGTVAYTGTGLSTTVTGLTNGTTYYFRACATDVAGNLSTGATASAAVAPEYDPPTGGTISLNSGAAWTNNKILSVAVSATDASGVSFTCLGVSATSCTVWAAYTTSTTYTATTTAGTKTVYAWFKDPYGNVSVPVSDSIGYDATLPTGGAITVAPTDGGLDLSWSGFTDATSGIASYKVVYNLTTAPSTCNAGTVAYTGASTSTSLTGLTNGTTYGLRICGLDAAGNQSAGVTTTGKPRPELIAPTGTVTIASGAAWTNNRTLSLSLTATDASGVARMCVSNTTTCTAWKTYAATTSIAASTGDGTKTVRVWFEDTWGNQSTVAASDTVDLDTVVPVNGTITVTPSAGGASIAFAGYTDARSGVASYTAVYAAGAAPTSCNAGTVGFSGVTASPGALTGLGSGTIYGVRVCAVDLAGNKSTGMATTFTAL